MKTSAKGIAFLERHEGVVLKAYRDPVGVWTIGAGLTAASGVVKPRAGMRITPEEASRLLAAALARSYEPEVLVAMASDGRKPAQTEFDAAISFHFNTGAIRRASWVKLWKGMDWQGTRKALLAWRKGGGKVLPGLVRRREEEFELLYRRKYEGPLAPTSRKASVARVVVPLSPEELAQVRGALERLGYAVGSDPSAISTAGLAKFQAEHDLTVDGVIGRATLSTLQRVLDARRKAAIAAPTTAVAAAEAGSDTLGDLLSGIPWLGDALLALAALYALYLALTYRDAIAAALHNRAPAVAALLRRF